MVFVVRSDFLERWVYDGFWSYQFSYIRAHGVQWPAVSGREEEYFIVVVDYDRLADVIVDKLYYRNIFESNLSRF